jgi:hypothetical protein
LSIAGAACSPIFGFHAPRLVAQDDSRQQSPGGAQRTLPLRQRQEVQAMLFAEGGWVGPITERDRAGRITTIFCR